LGYGLYRIEGLGINITSGLILMPFIFGGYDFSSSKNLFGRLLAAGSLIALIFGIISNVPFSLRHMTAFELITILVLALGGIGLFLRSLKDFQQH
jgi:hypothetical protein